MFSRLARHPAALASELASELQARCRTLDLSQFDELRAWLHFAVDTAAYAAKAKQVLTKPLRDRSIAHDASDWRDCGIKLYALWQGTRPSAIEKRMAELAEANRGLWQRTFPDESQITEENLLDLYKAGGDLVHNSTHDFSDMSLALRYYAAEQLAPLAKAGGGFFDWGGSDGVSCVFAASCGARDVHLHEPNGSNRAFATWLAGQLGIELGVHEHDPVRPGQMPPRRFAAGICTEVLEHVIDPPGMMRRFFDLLLPGGVIFVTSSFGVPQDSHLKSNLKYAGHEDDMMKSAGFRPWTPPMHRPMPFLPQWGFWQRPG